MSNELAQEGWITPPQAGPGRRWTIGLVALAVVLLGGWSAYVTDAVGRAFGDEVRQRVVVTVSERGSVTVDDEAVSVGLVDRNGVQFLVTGSTTVDVERGPVVVDVEAEPGIDADRIIVRTVRPHRDGDKLLVLVTVPVDVLPVAMSPVDMVSSGSIEQATERFDKRAQQVREDRRGLDQLTSAWWWIALLGVVVVAVAPLLAWRRAATRFLSMRRPGPGRPLEGDAPPSGLDPVGAAIMVAGTRPVDYAAAFAGHVLDLVERRQLPLRRSASSEIGVGTLVGLHHADELIDPVAPILLTLVADGSEDANVLLADSVRDHRQLSAAARAAWREHVDARARFERLVDRSTSRWRGPLVAALGVLTLASFVGMLLVDLDGERAVASLVASLGLAATASIGAWHRDAGRWLVVARARRIERAQWLAWRAAIDARPVAGAPLGLRLVPIAVATGTTAVGIRSYAPADAVELAAVTAKTIAALRALFEDA
jgi:hypothetical protein